MNYQPLPELQVKTEFVVQDKKMAKKNAGYLALNYNFLSSKYTPSLGYRFSHFSDQYDPMFYGNTVGFGTWFQGRLPETMLVHSIKCRYSSSLLHDEFERKFYVGCFGL